MPIQRPRQRDIALAEGTVGDERPRFEVEAGHCNQRTAAGDANCLAQRSLRRAAKHATPHAECSHAARPGFFSGLAGELHQIQRQGGFMHLPA